MFEFLKSNFRWIAGGFLLTYFSSFGQTFFISASISEWQTAFDLSHGEIGKGLNDYDSIFSELKRVGFDDNWISIEDGVEGMDQMHRSAEFLQRKIAEHWGSVTR